MKKTATWRKFRHRVTFGLLRWPFTIYTILRYGIRVERFREQGNRPYLVIMNHQTAWDQFFVCMAFRNPIYFLASEDLFSLGWISDVLRFLVAPIPIKKQTTDLRQSRTASRSPGRAAPSAWLRRVTGLSTAGLST